MDSISEIKTDDGHAEEIGIIMHDGHECAAGGFYIDIERGKMIAYVKRHEETRQDKGGQPYTVRSYSLHTWGGQHLARLLRTDHHAPSHYSLRPSGPVGFYGTRLQCFRTLDPIAGYYWHGRGLGAGMLLRLSRGRKA